MFGKIHRMSKEEKLDLLLNYYRKEWEERKEIARAGDFIVLTHQFKQGERIFYEKFLLGDCMIYPCGKNEYVLTSKGYFFDGYVVTKNRQEELDKQVKARNAQIIKNETSLIVWTRRVTLATWTAAILVALSLCWDVWKYYNPHFSESGGTIVRQIGIFF